MSHRFDVAVANVKAMHVLESEGKLTDPLVAESWLDRLGDMR